MIHQESSESILSAFETVPAEMRCKIFELCVWSSVKSLSLVNRQFYQEVEPFRLTVTAQITYNIVQQNGDLPEARYRHVMKFIRPNMICVYGGCSDSDNLGAHIYFYDTTTDRWTKHKLTGHIPTHFVDSFVWIEEYLSKTYLYNFGGVLNSFGTSSYSNDVHRLNLESFEWEKLTATGDIPSARRHTAGFRYQGETILFSGESETASDLYDNETHNGHHDNQTYVFRKDSCIANVWTHRRCTGPIPTPRVDFGYANIHGNAYIFGGCTERSRVNDLWCLNLTSFIWTSINVDSANIPHERGGHRMVAINENELFMCGGWYNGDLQDCWIYNIELNKWTEYKNSNFTERCCFRMVSTAQKDNTTKVYVFGGELNLQSNYLTELGHFTFE